jgi:hypothetical protein
VLDARLVERVIPQLFKMLAAKDKEFKAIEDGSSVRLSFLSARNCGRCYSAGLATGAPSSGASMSST